MEFVKWYGEEKGLTMSVPSIPPEHLEVIRIVERIKTLGFPNIKSIHKIEELVKQLQEFSPGLESIHQISIQRISEVVQKMSDMIAKEEEVPVNVYTDFYGKLVMLLAR